ncbi:hypothetical protein BDFB_015265, partial [Asbolus verrucosus]
MLSDYVLQVNIDIGQWSNRVPYCSRMSLVFVCVHQMDENVCGRGQVN